MTTRSSMFNRKRPTSDHANVATSLIAQGTCMTGDISFTGSLFLDGRIDGQVIATEPGALLTIGEQGVVRGNIDVPAAVVHGHVSGDVYTTERLELASSARIAGDLHYRSILVVAGAQINGRMHHRSPESEASSASAMPSDDFAEVVVSAELRSEEVATSSEETTEALSAAETFEPTNDASVDAHKQTAVATEPLLVVRPRKRGRMR